MALVHGAALTTARAQTFAEEVEKFSQENESFTLNQIPAVAKFLGKLGAKKLGALKLDTPKFEGGVLKANAKFLGINWRTTVYSNDNIKGTYITFGPTSTVSFKKMFKKVPGIEVLDIVVFDDQMLVLAGADLEIEADDLPEGAHAEFDRFFEEKEYTLEAAQGLTMFGALDLGKAKALKDAIKFLGGKESKIQLTAGMKPNILDSLLEGKPPQPSFTASAALPTFRPKIGGLVQLPANVQFSFNIEMNKDGVELGFAGNTDFKIGKQKVPVGIEETIKIEDGAPEIGVKMTVFEDEPWKKAFGIGFLTIEGYSMEVSADAKGVLSIESSGKTSIGGKQFDLTAAAQVAAATAGLPIPQELSLEINDGDDTIGQLTLRDMVSIFTEMARTSLSLKTKPNLDFVPDVAITGTEKGSGPKISMKLKANDEAGFDISGVLRILNTEVATVETAVLSMEEGLEIVASMKKTKIGPLVLPKATVDIGARINREEGPIVPPHVKIKAKDFGIFGGKSELDITMYLNSMQILSKNDYNSLLEFDLKAFAGLKKLKKFSDLGNTDFYLASVLKSDPAKWLRTAGKAAVQKAFDGLKPGINDAVKKLKAAEAEVDKLRDDMNRMRETVKKERSSSTNKLKNAEREVQKLDNDIKKLDANIRANEKKIKRCHQTIKLCIWYPFSTHCETVPNYPARAVCEAKNIPWWTAIAANETAKVGVIAARETAKGTLWAIRKGIENFPIDADVRIIGISTALHTAKGALIASRETVKGFGSFTDLLAKGVGELGKLEVFALERGLIMGSLNRAFRGDPVVLDLKYSLFKKKFQTRLGFSFTNVKFNVQQLEVLALGLAAKIVIKAGREAKIIPHALLNEVEDLYLKRRAEVDAVIEQVMADGGVTDTDADVTQMADSVAQDQFYDKAKQKIAVANAQAALNTVDGAKNDTIQRALSQALALHKSIDVVLQVNKSGRCIDNTGSTASAAKMHFWECNQKNTNQNFTFVTPNTGAKTAGGGWNILSKNQLAAILKKGQPGMMLRSHKSGMCLDVYRNQTTNGTPIIQYACHGQENQQWRLVDKPDGWSQIVSVKSGKCLDLKAGGMGNKVALQIWDCVDKNGHPNQLFRNVKGRDGKEIAAYQKLAADYYGPLPTSGRMYEVKTSGMCLDNSGSKTKGAQTHAWTCGKPSPNRLISAKPVSGDWVNLVYKATNMCLDVSGNSTKNGAKVVQWPCHKNANQQWRKVNRGNGWFSLQARHSEKCLDLAGGGKNKGTKFHQWDCNPTNANQLFRLQ